MYTIVTKPGCGNCIKAKSFLKSRNILFEEKVLGVDISRELLLETIPSNAQQMPVIFDDSGSYVGSYRDLVLLFESAGDKSLLLG